ncbi:MAG: ABC transporter permease, partial [Candidatus Neomarinimicrobiota bacterium]|nr:ABC transporter permease [Candidatus Neomarinimicrobiota bacterium]
QKIKIHFVGKEFAPTLYRSFESMEKVVIVNDIPEDSVEIYLQNEVLDASVTIQEDYQSKIDQNSQAKIQIQFKGTDSFNTTKEVIKILLKSSEDEIIDKRMARLNIEQDIVQAYKVEYVDVASKQEVIGSLIGGWLPYIFILFGFLGAMYPALDLGSGEKERGTLETILSSPASRFDIVLGKFLVIMLAAFLTAFLALTGLIIGINFIPDIPPQMMKVIDDMFAFKTIFIIMTLVLPVSAFFSAALLGLSIYAKSFKEAQSIAAPLNIAIVFTAVIGTMPGIELNAVTALIPILNVSLASKDIFAGVINPFYMIEVYLSLFGFAILSVLGCARAFNDENTLFRN